ncbi:MAG TPA: hypothetical protein VIY73_25785, partial [Polyangiaceae bacterium]
AAFGLASLACGDHPPRARDPMPPAGDDPSDRETPLPPAPAASSPAPEPSSPAPGASAPSFDDDPPSQKTPVLGVSPAVLHAHLSLPETQHRLRVVVAHGLGPHATRPLVDDLANEAQVRAITSDEPAESESALEGWLDGIAHRAVLDHFQGLRDRKEVFSGRGMRLEPWDRAAAAATAAGGAGDPEGDELLLSAWLRKRAQKVESERELLELLAYAARSRKSYEQVAVERGTTAAAIYNRIHRLKAKYAGEWREHREKALRDRWVWAWAKRALATAAVAVAIGLAYWLVTRPPREQARPVDDVDRLFVPPAPTASGFDNAAPTGPDPSAEPEREPPSKLGPKGPPGKPPLK